MADDPIQKLIAQYELGDTGGDVYEGSTPRQVAPQQQRPSGIPATKAVPPKDPVTGKFLPAHVVPSAPNAQRQVPSEEPLEQSEAPPQVFEHNRTLFRHAIQVGFTDAEIDSTPSEELQEKVFNRQREQFQQAQQSPTPNISAVEKPKEPEPEADLGELEKVLDPEIAKPLKETLTKQLRQLKALEAKLEAQAKQNEARTQQEKIAQENDNYDRMLTKHPVLGTKSWRELSNGDNEFIFRQAVLNKAATDKSSRSAQEKIDWAVGQLFGAQQSSEEPQRNGRPTKEDYLNGGVLRPTNRKPAPEIDDVKRARQAVQNRLEQLSQPGENGTVSVDDFPE